MCELVAVLEKFSAQHQIAVNPAKSYLMVVGKPATLPSMTLCGHVVPVRTSARYLGFDLCMAARGKSLVVNVANTVRSLFAASNSIIGIPQCTSPLTRAHLLKVFAVPLVDYAL